MPIFTSFIGCNRIEPRKRRNIEQPSVRDPTEFIVVTGEERSVNITCAAVGEFGTTTQVVKINVIGEYRKHSTEVQSCTRMHKLCMISMP